MEARSTTTVVRFYGSAVEELDTVAALVTDPHGASSTLFKLHSFGIPPLYIKITSEPIRRFKFVLLFDLECDNGVYNQAKF